MPLVLMTQKRVEQLVAAVAEAAGLADAAPTAQQAAQLAHADLVSLELHVTRQYSSAYSSCWPPKVSWMPQVWVCHPPSNEMPSVNT